MLLDRSLDFSLEPATPCRLDAASRSTVEQFLFRESRLLDERAFAEWLSLWTADGVYWMPRHHAQPDPFGQVSLIYEDAVLRETRARRLLNPRNWSQRPVTRSSRLVGNVQLDGHDAAGHLIVRSSVVLTEFRIDQRVLSGSVFHKLAGDPVGGWKLHSKRVNLVNCDSAFDILEVFV